MKDIAKKAIDSIGKPKSRRADEAIKKFTNLSLKDKLTRALRIEQIKDTLKP